MKFIQNLPQRDIITIIITVLLLFLYYTHTILKCTCNLQNIRIHALIYKLLL